MGQKVDYLRLSVTDRCNLYCMPPEGVPFKPHDSLLSYEDMVFFVEAAVEMGITKVRLTGGEPLVRKGVPDLVRLIRAIPGVHDISLTTNGVLLPRFVRELKSAGLDRVNISLDSLDPERYRLLTRGGSLQAALEGVEALRASLDPVKLNVVMVRGLLPELPSFVAITRDRPLHVRFIEWMPMGGCGPRNIDDLLTKAEVLAALSKLGGSKSGSLAPIESPLDSPVGWGPADYYRFPGHKGTVGFIGSVSDHFCGECNRLRLTADGRLKNCLFSDQEIDVKEAVRIRDRARVFALIRESLEDKTFDKNLLSGRTERGMSQVGG